MDSLGPIQPTPLSGDESLRDERGNPVATVTDFWRWVASDLLSNATRGVLAEFIVAHALGVTGSPRREWDAFDLTGPDGVKVEVKSAAYVQSWQQRAHSSIQFGVQPTRAWSETANTYEDIRRRQADVYVFALLEEKYQARVDPLDAGQWTFFVLNSRRLDEVLGEQKTLTLGRLRTLGPRQAAFSELADAVAEVANEG